MESSQAFTLTPGKTMRMAQPTNFLLKRVKQMTFNPDTCGQPILTLEDSIASKRTRGRTSSIGQKPCRNIYRLLCNGFDPVGTLRFCDSNSLALSAKGEALKGERKICWLVEGAEKLLRIA
ncbi:unnamed protein product [Dovyalis caffra]|uniref:Uncharacterized protein n=1 Tax=Dovyalis caffra TaxID=77055 RepID=A0AAV1SCN2_9ROSI|nr:unnamed protein product [Dovyalis caffra]